MNELTREGRSERGRSEHAVRAWATRGFGPSARFAVLGLALAASSPALAYVGPGAGLGVLGVVVAVLAAVVMGFFGLVMWPIRKIAQQRKAHSDESPNDRSARDRGTERDAAKRLEPRR